ncbi:Uncharacterised protein [Mycolicibacterium aichiense]|nr:Uncharacterised protein [Mycolicibacterium aichiense]
MPAAAVRAVMTDPDIRFPRRGIEIRAAMFAEPLDLDYLRFDHRLHFSECVLEGGFTARYAELRELTLTKVNVNGGIHAPGVVIKGRLDLSGAHLYHPDKVALDLHNSKITGSALVKGSVGADGKVTRCFSSSGTIRLDGAKIGGHLTMTTAVLAAPADLKNFRAVESGLCAMIFDGAEIDGDVIAGRGFRAYGEVRGVGATVGGQLNMTGAQIKPQFRPSRRHGQVANLLSECESISECESSCVVVVNPPSECEPGCGDVFNTPTETATRCAALTLDYARIGTDLFAEKGFEATGTVSAVGSSVGGYLKLTGAKVTLPPSLSDFDQYALVLNDARIALSVFAGIKTSGAVSATGVSIGDQLSLGGAVLRDPVELGVLILDGAKIGGDLCASVDKDSDGVDLKPLDAVGEVRALRVSIGGDLNLHGAELKNALGDALTLDNAQIGRHIFAEGNFTAEGTVRALGISVGRDIYLCSAQLTKLGDKEGDYGRALWLDGASIAGNLLAGFEENTTEHDATAANQTPTDQANAERKPFTVHGEVSARGITIGRDLDMSGATLVCPPTDENPTQCALQLDDAQVGGDFFACRREDAEEPLSRFRVIGAVRARGARIGGDLNLEGAVLKNDGAEADPQPYAIDFDSMHVVGSVLGGEGYAKKSLPCEITGTFRANNLVVGIRLDLSGAALGSGREQTMDSDQGRMLDNDQEWTLDLESATIAHLVLTPAIFDGGVCLNRARIDDLEADCDVGGAYRPPPSPLTATGWEIDDLRGPLRGNWKTARGWLDPTVKHPCRLVRWTSWLRRRNPSIAVQPWYTLADVYERNGDPAGARRLRIAAENKVTGQSPLLTRMVRALYCCVAGYGYYPLLAIVSMVILVGAATGMVWMGEAHIVETDRAAAARQIAHPSTSPPKPVTAQTACDEHSDYPCLQPLTFAINTVLPPAAGKNTDWKIAPNAPWLVIELTAVKLALWALAALFLAGVSGLLRKPKT